MSLLAKWDFIKSISIVSDAFGGEVKVIPSGNYESADWGKYSVTLEANRSFVNTELTIIVKGRDPCTRAGRFVDKRCVDPWSKESKVISCWITFS